MASILLFIVDVNRLNIDLASVGRACDFGSRTVVKYSDRKTVIGINTIGMKNVLELGDKREQEWVDLSRLGAANDMQIGV